LFSQLLFLYDFIIFNRFDFLTFMNETHVKLLAERLNLPELCIKNTLKLLMEGATVPFISRYRKEMTGGLNEVEIIAIRDQWKKLVEIDKRRETILRSIEEQGKLTEELKKRLENTYRLQELEDLYLPYKPKRKTKASVAREKGLEPLALFLLEQTPRQVEEEAKKYITSEVPDTDEAIKGACDIIAEMVNENEHARHAIRRLFADEARIFSEVVKGKAAEGIKYNDYFNFEEPLRHCPSHRFLAMRRGMEEGFLKITIEPDRRKALQALKKIFIKNSSSPSARYVEKAIEDAYRRLLQPSIETEFFNAHKEKADEEAIKVFAENLRQLLMAPPLGPKRILAIDPGFRTGCKVVCLDEQGNLLHHETIYPHPPHEEKEKAREQILQLIETYRTEAIAIGNGTAGRETEEFIRQIIHEPTPVIYMVSEAGASVYSASEVAREEFPDEDVTVRGAVSIGRRLMDPLAELVKIDPKSIGVGQYQHDVDQKRLKESLDEVVESCVNKVGVNVNTASKHLLMYVSGLGPQLAQAIIEYRKKQGPFTSRTELLNVPRMGTKAFEQCAGFLRIPGAQNPLDNSAVHPESYPVVEKMASDLNTSVSMLMQDAGLRKQINLQHYLTDTIGLPTLHDIMQELEKPGRDPRMQISSFEFSKEVHSIDDLRPGMILPGIVTNITRFGCFVDIGVKQDGLVHISQMSHRFIKDPAEVVKLHQPVKVKVLEIDVARKRIQLSMKAVKEDKNSSS